MLRFTLHLFLAIYCLAGSHFALLQEANLCVADDGCVSLKLIEHQNHHCHDEEATTHEGCCVPVYKSSSQAPEDLAITRVSTCTDLELKSSSWHRERSDVATPVVVAVLPPQAPFFAHFAPTFLVQHWQPKQFYPPPILAQLRTVIILC